MLLGGGGAAGGETGRRRILGAAGFHTAFRSAPAASCRPRTRQNDDFNQGITDDDVPF